MSPKTASLAGKVVLRIEFYYFRVAAVVTSVRGVYPLQVFTIGLVENDRDISGAPSLRRFYLGGETTCTVSYTHLTLPTICSV